MQVGSVAPSFEQLRPLKPTTSGAFPVYPDLADTLVSAVAHPDPTVAHAMATCAGYSYGNPDTLAMIMARMGLHDNRCLMIEQNVDALLICSTAFLVQSADGRVVIVSYRGTQPMNFINWLTGINVDPDTVAFAFDDGVDTFDVHAGFYRNMRATRHQVITALDRAMQGQSVLPEGGSMPYPAEAIYLTGHSLGGAMAAFTSVALTTEKAYRPIADRLRAAYTFGQPMIGSPEFAAACTRHPFLEQNLIRYVYRRDVVPLLPPTASGPFAHFGTEYQYQTQHSGGQWQLNQQPRPQLPNLLELAQAPLAFLARQIRLLRNLPFHVSLDDHSPQHYITSLTPPGVSSEFGRQ